MNSNIYVGRFVTAALLENERIIVGYRVSSRSFANRKIIRKGDIFSVVPINPDDYRDNPYISYNCLRTVSNAIIVSNGSQTDPITEKIALGYPIRDSLALSLLALDYEKDKYNTPRIACVVDYSSNSITLAIIKPDKLEIRDMSLKKGEACLISTYELTDPWHFKTKSKTTEEYTSEIHNMEFTHPVCALSAILNNGNLESAIINP